MNSCVRLFALLGLSGLVACGSGEEDVPFVDTCTEASPCGSREDAEGPLAAVTSWVYQLQGHGEVGLDPRPFASSGHNLAVIDYSRNGSEDGAFSASEISALKRGNKRVLAYVSIGEAEEDRFYFDTLPRDLVSAKNPAFEDNYKVTFCDARWQSIVMRYVDKVIAQGFDGVYLDIVDGFRYFTPGCASFCEDECEGSNAARDMAAFVTAIASHARAMRPGFIVVPQNAATIIDELPNGGAAYLAVIDGIGQEDSFYYDEDDTLSVNAHLDPQPDVLAALQRYVDAGKTVLAVDYLTDESKIADFYSRARVRGWVPYVAGSRDLDSMNVAVRP